MENTPSTPMVAALSVNSKVFGNTALRDTQARVIKAVLSRESDVLSIMPTGSGKTFCFQLPAVLEKGFAVVVSPINSLMEEQVDTLVQNIDLPALCYT